MMAVSIFLKTFCSTTRNCRIRCVRFDPYSELGMNHTARIRISYYEIQTYEVSFNSLTDNLSHSFVRKNVFYGKNIKYAYNFYRTDLNVCRDVFRTQSNIYSGAFLWKPQKSFNVDAWLGSKYVSGRGFTVEKVYKSLYLSNIVKVDFKNLSLRSCFSNK